MEMRAARTRVRQPCALSDERHSHAGGQEGVVDLELDGHALGGLLVLLDGAVEDALHQGEVRLAAPHSHHRLQQLEHGRVTESASAHGLGEAE